MNLISIAAAVLLAQASPEWPTFRGPTGDGVAPAGANPPVEWSETKNVAWKIALPGRGRSSPVIFGDRVFVTFAREMNVQRKKIGPDDMQTADHVSLGAACIDRATGKILWERTLTEVDKPEPVHFLNSWATPTPAIIPGRFFCDFGGWGTWCLEPESGKILWEKKIPLDHQVGPGSSLALHGKLLIFVRDGRDSQYVLALDQATGEQVWKTDRPPVQTSHPNSKKSFSTAIEIESGGKKQLVAVGPHWVASYDPDTGRELWRLRHGDGYSIGSVPVFGGDVLYVGTGCSRPNMLAMKVDGSGEQPTSGLVWRSVKGIPMMSSPVLLGKDVYWNSDDGVATCADASTGTARWQSRLGEGTLASPIAAAGRVYFFGREGKGVVVKPGEAFERLAENKLDGILIATPAVAGKSLFIRTDTHLYRIENP
jgi:outer membrane protein assembly factor BamB